VVDNAINRIATYNAQNAFVRAFGFDVIPGNAETGYEICTALCKLGVAGGAAGQLDFTNGIEADAAGNLHVGDFNNFRIGVYTGQGAFVRAYGFDVIPGNAELGYEICTTSCQPGDGGFATGQLGGPTGIAVDCNGAIYVAENDAQRVQRFGEPGTPLPPCTTPGTQPPATPKPSNEFTIKKLKRNTEKGTAKLTVELPGPGDLELGGSKVKARSKDVDDAGAARLAVKAKGNAKEKLVDRGKVKVKLKVTFTPTGGDPNTETKKGKLKLED
jgi:hypothetical protein